MPAAATKSPIFVVSTGRTGTQAIAHSVARLELERFYAVHEPTPSRIFRLASNLYMAGLLRRAPARTLISSLRRSQFARAYARQYLESNNFLFGLIEPLSELYAARFLHIVRHPVSYAQSHLRHGAFRGVKGWAGRFCPFWLSRPNYAGYGGERWWLQMTQYERLFWVWRLVNEEIEHQASGLGSRYLFVRFEDLFSRPDTYQRVLTWLGLSATSIQHLESEMRYRTNAGRGTQAVMASRDEARLDAICGPLIKRYGY